jgi:hypothetical protein
MPEPEDVQLQVNTLDRQATQLHEAGILADDEYREVENQLADIATMDDPDEAQRRLLTLVVFLRDKRFAATSGPSTGGPVIEEIPGVITPRPPTFPWGPGYSGANGGGFPVGPVAAVAGVGLLLWLLLR